MTNLLDTRLGKPPVFRREESKWSVWPVSCDHRYLAFLGAMSYSNNTAQLTGLPEALRRNKCHKHNVLSQHFRPTFESCFRKFEQVRTAQKVTSLAQSWKKVQQRDFQKLPFEPCELCSLVPVYPKSCKVATAVQSIGPEKDARKLMRTNTMRFLGCTK